VETVLRVADLKKFFPARVGGLFNKKRQLIHAVDGVSFEVRKGETFGIVGESGCGKTTLGRLILRLEEPTSGKVFFKDQDITLLSRSEMKKLRRQMQMIFQDPYSSLDPRQNVLNIVAEPLHVHNIGKNSLMVKEMVQESLRTVDLPTSDNFLGKIPGELSGGERQRVGVARVLVLGAEFIVADEPVSMLDATVKAGVISLLMGLKREIGLTYIFITHEIGLAYYICDRIATMYLGKIVELGKAEEIVNTPLHPYTKLLMEAIPPLRPDEKWGGKILERGEIPLYIEPPSGCHFHPRCSEAEGICRIQKPELVEVGENHFVACHQKLPEKVS
jgi:oligopeptide/dipeptide ABC transporter ATP-binding protein